MSTPTETETVAARLDLVQDRIERACRRSGRSAEDVTLVAVTKTFSVEVVQTAYDAGLRHFGENRVQELIEKAETLVVPEATWHLIGHLQRNKAKAALEQADVFHALDSLRLANTLEGRLEGEDRTLPCFVQVNVSGEESKYGLEPDAVGDVLAALAEKPHLEVVGLMTLAAPTPDPEQVRPQFRLLRRLMERHQKGPHPLRYLSMGMSGDFEVALEEGATHIRLGSVLFGARS